MMNLIAYRTILNEHLPTDLVVIIEMYYVSLFYHENILLLSGYQNDNIYYTTPIRYLTCITFDEQKSHRTRIETVCRYWIYNSDLIYKSNPTQYSRLKTAYKSLLKRNLRIEPTWDKGKYYYRQIHLVEYDEDEMVN
jgi:hypothetical protein